MAFVIPPLNDLPAMAKFFTDHPDWSPVFNSDGELCGIRSPFFFIPPNWMCTQHEDFDEGGA